MLIDFITPAEATASFKTFLVGGGIAVMAAQLQGKIKPGRTSLIGGIAVGIAVFVLWVALLSWLSVAFK